MYEELVPVNHICVALTLPLLQTNRNDFSEADDLYAALEQFSTEYPQFAPNPQAGLWLSGESYGGEYITHFAHRIVFGDSLPLKSSLKGIILGNPALSCESDRSGHSAGLQYQLYYHHGLMSYEQFSLWGQTGCDSKGLSAECQKLLSQADIFNIPCLI